MAHDGVDHLGLVVAVLALEHILGRDSALGQINVTLLLVDSQHNDDLVSSDTDEFLDGSDTSSGQFAEQDHAVDVVVLEQLDTEGSGVSRLAWSD